MIKKISRTEEIEAKLKAEGKVTYLDSPEHMEAIRNLNREMRNVHREFIRKNYNSEQSAKDTFFTT